MKLASKYEKKLILIKKNHWVKIFNIIIIKEDVDNLVIRSDIN
jgi:hypothetical protein